MVYFILSTSLNELVARKNKTKRTTQNDYDIINMIFNSMASFDDVMSKRQTEFPQVDNSPFLKELYSCLRISPNRINEA